MVSCGPAVGSSAMRAGAVSLVTSLGGVFGALLQPLPDRIQSSRARGRAWGGFFIGWSSGHDMPERRR